MALERVGLGAIVTADTRPMVKAMAQGRDSMGRFVAQSNKVPPPLNRIGMAATRLAAKVKMMATRFKSGAAMMGAGMMKLGMGLLPMGLALGGAIKKAADFEKQMSAVSAITQATAEDQAALAKKAKQVGIVSAFSATQAAEGMEFMARAGASTAEVLSGLDGVTNLAAADNIDLAASADIVSRVVRGMGMEFSDAAHIADVLALASAKSNTNVQALGQSFIYGASTARQAGISLEETVAIFGKMADAGLKGSLAGTGLTNMLGKLTKPTSKAKAMMKKWRIELDKDDGSLRNISDIVADFSKQIEALPKKSERLAAAQEIFGKRGARAYGALAAAGADATQTLEELLKAASEGEGAAARMASKRLDNLLGKLTLFKSSLEGLAISVFGPLLKIWSKGIGKMTDALNTVLFAMMDIEEATDDVETDYRKLAEAQEKYGDVAFSVAMGIKDATATIGNAFIWLQEKIKAASKTLTESLGEDGVRKLTKIVVIIGMVAGALAPMLLAGMMLKWVFGGMISILAGVAKMVIAAFWPMVIAIGAVFLAYQLLKRENESFGETASRVWGDIKTKAAYVWNEVIKPMWQGIKEGFTPAIEELGVVWDEVIAGVKVAFVELYEFMFGKMDETEICWREVGRVIGAVVGAIATAILVFVKYAIPIIASIVYAIKTVISVVWGVITGLFENIFEHVTRVVSAFRQIFSGSILDGLARLGTAILDMVLTPLQLLMKMVVMVAKALGKKLPQKLETFAESGLTGVVFPALSRKAGARMPGVKAPAPTGGRHTFDKVVGMRQDLPDVRYEAAKVPKIDWWQAVKDLSPKQVKKKFGITKEQAKEKYFKEKGWEYEAPTKKAKASADAKALAKALGAKQPKVDVDVNLEDKRQLEIQNSMCIDGEGVTIASARHKQELQERAGFKATPWQRRAMLEHGAAPIKQAS